MALLYILVCSLHFLQDLWFPQSTNKYTVIIPPSRSPDLKEIGHRSKTQRRLYTQTSLPLSVEFDQVFWVNLVAIKYDKDFGVDYVIHATVKEVRDARVFGWRTAEARVSYCVLAD